MKKKMLTALLTGAMMLAMGTAAFAAGWQQDAGGWKWINDDGTAIASQWAWLDGNQDGVAECYCFGPDGYMYANTTTPDGYRVNADGQWQDDWIPHSIVVDTSRYKKTEAGANTKKAAAASEKLNSNRANNAASSIRPKTFLTWEYLDDLNKTGYDDAARWSTLGDIFDGIPAEGIKCWDLNLILSDYDKPHWPNGYVGNAMSFDKNSGGYGNSGLAGPVFDISLHIAGPGKEYDGVFIIGNMKPNGGNENTWNDYTVYPDTACYIEPNIYRNW